MAKPFLSLLLQGYTRAIILPIHQAQGPSMWLSPGPGPNSKYSKTVEAKMFISGVKLKSLLALDSY